MQLTDKQKYEIIIKRELGHSILQIAKSVGVNKNTVSKWINTYAANKDIKRNSGSGRNKKTTTEQDITILDEVQKNKFISALEIKKNLEQNGIVISRRTVINRLHNSLFVYKVPTSKPLLTDKHRANRLQWAMDNKLTDWTKVIFSDETSIWKGSGGRKRWLDMTKDNVERTVKYPLKRHVCRRHLRWGCISLSADIKNMHIFGGIMDSTKYIEILNTNLLKVYNNNMIFQHDNDPKHKSHTTTDWLADNGINCLQWPSCSPDLNPIENIWALLKRKVSEVETITSTEFEQSIKTSWDNLDIITIANVLKSMPRRIELVIENKGEIINY